MLLGLFLEVFNMLCCCVDIVFKLFCVGELLDSMKRFNLRITGIEEGDSQLQGPENIFNKIIEENFPNLK